MQPKPGPQAQYPQTKTTVYTTWSAQHPSVLAQQQYAAQKRLAGGSNPSGKSSARTKAPARHKLVLA